jgi:hypothetical protein
MRWKSGGFGGGWHGRWGDGQRDMQSWSEWKMCVQHKASAVVRDNKKILQKPNLIPYQEMLKYW